MKSALFSCMFQSEKHEEIQFSEIDCPEIGSFKRKSEGKDKLQYFYYYLTKSLF